ncbi:sperm microtubule associated protein 1-like [Ambystoma mexicanum]|uniref:sperm microtubule associated protein 1-like n=1 Tax=Ambystoma mexicanum TaxID=8296 RepID=UPI0037E8AB86
MLHQRKSTSFSRFAPAPSEHALQEKERRFVLDCVAVASIAREYRQSLPKLVSAIPPYNSQQDLHVSSYFKTKPVPPLLRKTGQSKGGTSIYGELADYFQRQGAAAIYLRNRNSIGAGHSTENLKGHGFTSIKPIFGYNGNYGYRRNIPTLRSMPSSFGLVTNSPIN